MCGRVRLARPGDALARLFGLEPGPDLVPRWNVAPTQPLLAVRRRGADLEAFAPRWGLVPPGSPDGGGSGRLINARAETAARRPAFRDPFRSRRCLVPVDGFYEWQRVGRRRQPWLLALRGDEPFALAGLWEAATPAGGPAVETVAVLTTAANELVAPLHDRMPVIVGRADFAAWLDPDRPDPATPLGPWPAAEMVARPVGPRVNDVRNEGPGCAEPAGPGAAAGAQGTLF